ncbi:MAG TPA: hypothetical protein VK136_09050 [Bacillota bacterium]|nr:hypothetical protein [Bacillota bacterium]
MIAVDERLAGKMNLELLDEVYIKRFAYHNDTLIEYTVSVAHGNKFAYTAELTS